MGIRRTRPRGAAPRHKHPDGILDILHKDTRILLCAVARRDIDAACNVAKQEAPYVGEIHIRCIVDSLLSSFRNIFPCRRVAYGTPLIRHTEEKGGTRAALALCNGTCGSSSRPLLLLLHKQFARSHVPCRCTRLSVVNLRR